MQIISLINVPVLITFATVLGAKQPYIFRYRRRLNAFAFFEIYQEIIDDFAEIYKDIYEIKTVRRYYNRFHQGFRIFVKFYSEFRRFAGICGINHSIIMSDFEKKFRPELKKD